MDNMVMRIAFGTSATVFRKINLMNYNSTFYHVKLSDVEHDIVDPVFFNDKNKFETNVKNFEKIPGNIIAYWISENFIKSFEKGISIDEISDYTGSQNITANNNKYLRYHWEVNKNDLNNKWRLYSKGGEFRKYFGNLEHVVDWSDEARNFYKTNKTSNLLDEKYWYKEGITYTSTSSKGTGFRYLPKGCLFDKKGPAIVNIKYLLYIIGFLNSKVVSYFLKFLAPTIDIQVKNIKEIPLIIDNSKRKKIEEITLENIKIAYSDWNNKETSFDFKINPLISSETDLKKIYCEFQKSVNNKFKKMKINEEIINRYFIEIYDLKEELSPHIENNNITLFESDYETDIKSFVSYAVGCMFGRYSLDNEGLQFAGGGFDLNDYHKFVPDDDNIIPVLDSEYFDDDIVGRFVEFVKTCFGEENLEKNLDFIANALAKNKKPPREKIRDYLLKNFFNDHKKTYKKCPIYWQFSSGKENGFNCLIYLHRYEPSLIARIRTDYLHKTQKAIEQSIINCDNIINHSSSNTEITKATKDKNKLQKQLKETQEYDEALSHIANQNIKIDLDNGVKVNYAKFQNIEVSKEGKKSKKINLLKKL